MIFFYYDKRKWIKNRLNGTESLKIGNDLMYGILLETKCKAEVLRI